MGSNLDKYLEQLNEGSETYLIDGKITNIGKALKSGVRKIISSRIKSGSAGTTSPEILKKIKILNQKNQELFLNDKISSSELMKRILRLQRMMYG